VALLFVSSANAWGVEGHAIVAQVAAAFLSESSTSIVQKFLGGSTMASVSSDADDYRETSGGAWSAPYHYINALKTQTVLDLATDCGNGVCVIDAIYNYTKRFSNDDKSPFACNLNVDQAEPCALVFLIHFVGDVHQPLHCGYGYDRGGNEVKVTWYGTETNLHSVWDVSIIEKWNTDFTSAAQELIADLKNSNPYGNTTDALAMGNESFFWVRNLVYHFSGSSLSDQYYNLALPLVKERLAAAGYRLALIINAIADSLDNQVNRVKASQSHHMRVPARN